MVYVRHRGFVPVPGVSARAGADGNASASMLAPSALTLLPRMLSCCVFFACSWCLRYTWKQFQIQKISRWERWLRVRPFLHWAFMQWWAESHCAAGLHLSYTVICLLLLE